MNTTTSLDYKTLAADWMAAKSKENAWKEKRLAIEAELMQFFPNLPEEGQRTYNEAGYKTVAKNDLNIKVINRDAFVLAVTEGSVPSNIVQFDIYETGFKRLRRLAVANDEQALNVYSRILPLFSVTPAKTGFTVVKGV